jgi:hypothetical protein
MARALTADDEDKPVVMADGTHVGTVSDVHDGQARVTPTENADLTEVVKSALGWDDADDTHDLQNDDIETVNDEQIQLRSR